MNLNSFLSSIDLPVDWIGLRYVCEHQSLRQAKNGVLMPFTQGIDEGIMVEILKDGQIAYAATPLLTREGVQAAAKRALAHLETGQIYGLFSFDQKVRPASQGRYESPHTSIANSAQEAQLIELTRQLSHHMKQKPHIVNATAVLLSIDIETAYVSSSGAAFEQLFHQRASHLTATAQQDNQVQTRSNGFPVVQKGDEFFQEIALMSEADRLTEEALALVRAPACPEGRYDVLLMPDQLYLQIHESIGHPLELDRILGDERNYAGWSFVNPQDFGTLQYGSPLLNVTFDPHATHEFASYNFDDTGAQAHKDYLIKDGKLMRGIGGLESQHRSHLPGVSSARASSWNRPPLDRMANINIEAGSSSLQEMIAETERGILMKTNRSWSIDDYRRKFQFGCEYGQLIEKGKLTQVVRNPSYRGETTPFWHQLKRVGDASTLEVLGSLYCGKGEPNQIIRVGHATPACLFENLEVFGGGK